jgi:hypothetical protein
VVRDTYVALELTGWYVIVPFCLAALITGPLQASIREGNSWRLSPAALGHGSQSDRVSSEARQG